MINPNILIILEGKNPEIRIIKRIECMLNLGLNAEIIFGGNIYELYCQITSDPFSNIEGSNNIFKLVQGYCKDPSLVKINNPIFDKYTVDDFSHIFMFFDFDPQAINTKNKLSQVKEMLKTFNNPTENGKLYINYPSVESFNHITRDFQNLIYNQGANFKGYKETAGNDIDKIREYTQLRRLERKDLLLIFQLHIKKANFICNSLYCIPNNVEDISQINLYEVQALLQQQKNLVYTISSIPIAIFELFDYKLFCIDA